MRAASALATACLLAAAPVDAQTEDSTAKPKKWYEKVSLRGYTQIRYNRLLETNPLLTCSACDRSIGATGGFFIRRARLTFTFEPHDRVTVYIQPDLAQDAAGAQHYLQIRDLYGDVFIDRAKTLRARVGQSKVPWGWDNLQSSSNRLAFDRSDAINSGAPNERDLGVFVYWAPVAVRRRLRELVDSGFKGTGDYGLIGVGVYNGESANRPEQNGRRHVAARATYPFRIGARQFVEVGGQYYRGTFTLAANQRTAGVGGPADYVDERVAASAVIYPQPIGVQAEWTWGRGPEYDPVAHVTREHRLRGGYVQLSARLRARGRPLQPYARAQYYDGGKKIEVDARHYHVRELEIGAEYQPIPALELTAAYVASDRTFEDGALRQNRQKGRLLRLQAQLNY